MRDQIECIQNLAIHMQAELNEINERCKRALAKESQNTSTNTDSTKFSCDKRTLRSVGPCPECTPENIESQTTDTQHTQGRQQIIWTIAEKKYIKNKKN